MTPQPLDLLDLLTQFFDRAVLEGRATTADFVMRLIWQMSRRLQAERVSA